MNYYNEYDRKAAAALRQLIADKLIPEGIVDERSITEVRPAELAGFTQCHFFAGIGGWSLALQLADWPADRPVWTGSCPCQPFSSAGKQKGKADERHLWPVWFELIRKSRPPDVFGEQVSAAIRHHWWDDVADDLEREGYTTRAEIRPACSIGAPHKRDRLWFVAHGSSKRLQNGREQSLVQCRAQPEFERCSGNGTLADTWSEGLQGHAGNGQDSDQPGWVNQEQIGSAWQGGVWIDCPDGKQRLIEPGICLLAHGFSERVGLLTTAGNAIVPQVAAQFIKTYMNNEAEGG